MATARTSPPAIPCYWYRVDIAAIARGVFTSVSDLKSRLESRDHPAWVENAVRVEAILQAAVQGGYRRLQRMEASGRWRRASPT